MRSGSTIILFNDTSSVEANPGCALTMAGLISLLGNQPVERKPLGYGYREYRVGRRVPIMLARLFWKLLTDASFRSARDVVINGEGTIHHEEKGAHVLLYLLALSRLLGKRVYLVNCSIQQLSTWNLRLLKLASCICVREQLSQAYLASQGIESSLALDCAFLADTDTPATRLIPRKDDTPVCIFTPGVLLEHQQDNEDFLRKHFARIREMGYDPVYLQVQEKEDKDLAFWERIGGRTVRLADYEAASIFSVLRESDLVISGRYHIIIFTIMVKKPFITLDTNTWKIAGLLASIDSSFGTSFSSHCTAHESSGMASDHSRLEIGRIREQIMNSYRALGSAFKPPLHAERCS